MFFLCLISFCYVNNIELAEAPFLLVITIVIIDGSLRTHPGKGGFLRACCRHSAVSFSELRKAGRCRRKVVRADPKIVSTTMRTETTVAQIHGLHRLAALTGGNSPLLFCTGKRGSSHGKLVLFLPTLFGLGWSIYNDEAYLVAREQKLDDLESSHIDIFLGKSKGLWNIS